VEEWHVGTTKFDQACANSTKAGNMVLLHAIPAPDWLLQNLARLPLDSHRQHRLITYAELQILIYIIPIEKWSSYKYFTKLDALKGSEILSSTKCAILHG
jgi:hypothetical protein